MKYKCTREFNEFACMEFEKMFLPYGMATSYNDCVSIDDRCKFLK